MVSDGDAVDATGDRRVGGFSAPNHVSMNSPNPWPSVEWTSPSLLTADRREAA